MRPLTTRLTRLLPGLALVALAAMAGPAHAITITIVNNDSPGVGFNDATPASPVGGNPGTTIGQQRLNVFQQAASIWGGLLPGSVTIQVNASFAALTCTSTSAVLGSAGATQIFRDFAGAPVAGHWFSVAEANKITNSDLAPGSAEIQAQFNVNLGQPGCLTGSYFYYGYDGNEGTSIDLLAVLLHELGHGLGFQTYTDGSTGSYTASFPSIWDKFLFDGSTSLHWDQMTALQRKTSALNGGKLVWDGPSVTMAAQSYLGPRTVMVVNSPAGIAGIYGAGAAAFGPALNATGITGNVVQAIDATAPVNDGCEAFTNGAAIAGNIALVDRGLCNFTVKVKNAQNLGAIAVIVADNTPSAPAGSLGGSDPTVTIPAVRITQADGNLLKANLGAGVNVTLRVDPSSKAGADNAGRVMMYAPNPYQSGSSVSHWEVTATPNLLMEPAINTDLNASSDPYAKVDLTRQNFEDIGWYGPAATVDEAQAAPGLLSNSPNPFASYTAIHFEMARDGAVDLAIYDVGGRLVKQLAHGSLSRGTHVLAWDGRDTEGRPVASGVYLYRLRGEGGEQVERMLLFR
jgi:hypothetical protein